MEALPLTEAEDALLQEGIQEFDSTRYWHAHESWEDLWNSLKRREASRPEILGIQGLIQTAALLYNHQREKRRGVLNQWEKLLPKLDVWTHIWGIDVVTHLKQIRRFVEDVDTWNETYESVRIPIAEME
ncbi:DUF309 domain-containing protein [Candidatus Poseidoniales archaeon]|nr:DUF309 domain-containing protein [Candidatus Poseidoniales archaeon]MDC3316854.1 DUF309 domain-containing protein [Candidatus Poseidoniaceae archaeon]|tara:strand:+ start:5665 stop:6051 length:387 start_codon:yes stop_codon:yes gene_type:complete